MKKKLQNHNIFIKSSTKHLTKINLNFSSSGNDRLFYDVIYNPQETQFLKMGKKLGYKTENGKTMFVYQALEAFKLWHRIEPKVNKDTFNVAFQEDYAVEVEIFQLDEQNNRTYGIKLVEAFPRSLNLMELNHNAQNQTHRLIVLFAYRRWERIT